MTVLDWNALANKPGLVPAGRDPPHAPRARRAWQTMVNDALVELGVAPKPVRTHRAEAPRHRVARAPRRASGPRLPREPQGDRRHGALPLGPDRAGRCLPACGSRPTAGSRACPAGPGRSSCAPGSSTAPARRVPACSRSGSSSVSHVETVRVVAASRREAVEAARAVSAFSRRPWAREPPRAR